MSNGEMPPPASEEWHASSQIRVALTILIVPAFIRIAQHSALGPWLASHLGLDIVTMKAEDIVNWILLLISTFGSIFWVHKRVKAGKDPASNAPQIVPPVIIQRLTGNTPISRDP